MLCLKRKTGEGVVVAEEMLVVVHSVRPAAVMLLVDSRAGRSTVLLELNARRSLTPGIEVVYERRLGATRVKLGFEARPDVPVDRLEVWARTKLGLPEPTLAAPAV